MTTRDPMAVFVGGARPLLLRGIAAELEDAGLSVIVSVAANEELCDLTASLAVDVAVLDFPTGRRARMTRMIHRRCPQLSLLVIVPRCPSARLDAIRAGACGCVAEDDPPAHLLSAVNALRAEATSAAENAALGQRSPRGRLRQVLTCVALGQSNKDIADELAISVRTVESHRHRLMTTLGARGTADLVRYAIRTGVIEA